MRAMMSYRSIITSFICLSGLLCSAQTRISDARKEMNLFNYSKAVVILQEQVAKGNATSKRESGLMLADCYRMLNDAENALIWYEKVLEGDPPDKGSPAADAWFHYAQALRTSGQYQKAKKVFLLYDSLAPDDHSGQQFAAFCDSAILWQSAKPGFITMNLKPVNSPQSEFGTVYYRQGILFASDRARADEAGKIYGWTGNNYLSLFYAGPSGKDSIAGPFKDPEPAFEISDQEWHDGPVSFNKDFTEMFINRTQAAHDKGKKGQGHVRTHLLKIFVSNLEGDKWSTPQPFFMNSDEYSVGHPALAPDGNTLYFVSDMKDGFGETDIYCCKREGGKWNVAETTLR